MRRILVVTQFVRLLLLLLFRRRRRPLAFGDQRRIVEEIQRFELIIHEKRRERRDRGLVPRQLGRF